jgi:hypothetical protein
MKLTIIGDNVIVECKRGHTFADNIGRLLRLNTDTMEQIGCPGENPFGCEQRIYLYKLKEEIEDMIHRGDTEREIGNA